MRGYKPFWYVPEDNIMIGSSPKVATKTLQNVLRANGVRTLDASEYDCPRYFVVRPPVARFKSLWKSKCRDEDHSGQPPLKMVIAGFSPEDLMDYIESEVVWDQHWARQSEILGDAEVTLIPLNRLSEFDERFTVYNSTSGDVELSNDIIMRVIEYYKDDLMLYEKACRLYK